MPVTLPLALVLHIVSLYIQRDFFEEDWAPYHYRLAPLCLVCTDFKELVQPVMWSHLCVSTDRYLKKLSAPETGVTHLLQHVKEFVGLAIDDRSLERLYLEDTLQLVKSAMPNAQSIGLRSFGGRTLWMEALSSFPLLTSLALEDYTLSKVPACLVFPSLRELALVRVYASIDTFKAFLRESCTPSLRGLYLAQLYINVFHEPYLPLEGVDLHRIEAVQLKVDYLSLLPSTLVGSSGPFTEETHILCTWTANSRDHLWGGFQLPCNFQIHIPPEMLDAPTSQFAKSIRRVLEVVWGEELEVIFLPSSVRHRSSVPKWIQRGLRTLFDECIEADISIYFYNDTSDESSFRMSDAFLRYVDNPALEDENPLKVESRRARKRGAQVHQSDDGTLWTFAKGFGEMGLGGRGRRGGRLLLGRV